MDTKARFKYSSDTMLGLFVEVAGLDSPITEGTKLLSSAPAELAHIKAPKEGTYYFREPRGKHDLIQIKEYCYYKSEWFTSPSYISTQASELAKWGTYPKLTDKSYRELACHMDKLSQKWKMFTAAYFTAKRNSKERLETKKQFKKNVARVSGHQYKTQP